ncbi:DUF3397 domain-containing protein [Paenibacillus hunanensis]|uniref:DUF3397 domain-containing protein n=1 Tax=Paenibacillus hunanensis TaxID=539262 RepID=A0ABU1J458_9BACL|nr:DUF3397 domain-containing protein [Paenibacillus hunanensis]MDR6245752.1 hypothetical protein [Paenibacillus hunanensis]GGJ19627.1 hypothetical protein GCM10008022_30940 [Paenibacillus hunanensis]
MGGLFGWLLNGAIFLSLVPFIPFVAAYLIAILRKKTKKQAVAIAMDVTTPFLYISVAALFNTIFNSKLGFYIFLLILLLALGLIGSAQNRLKGKVDFQRLFRAVWRLSFFFLSLGYIVLLIIAILQYITR